MEVKTTEITSNNKLGVNQYAPQGRGTGENDELLGFRLPSDLKAAIKQAAQAQGVSLSDWIKDAAIQKLTANK